MLFRRRSERSGKLKWIFLIVLLVVICFFSFRYYVGSQLEKGNEALKNGDLVAAELNYRKVSKLPLSRGRGHDGLGTIALLQGRFEDAKNHFQVVLANQTSTRNSCVEAALYHFIKDGAYEEGEMFRSFLAQWQGDNLRQYSVDFAVIALGNFELAKARSYLSNTTPELKQTERYKRALEYADECELNEEIPIVFDRNGETLMVYSLISNEYEYATPQLFAGWSDYDRFEGTTSHKKDWKNHIFTTMDLDLQRVAHQSMKGYAGTMILLDPSNGDILAAYGTEDHSPFSTRFEPGSVIKVLTYATLLENSGNSDAYAPKKYPGNMVVDGKLFYDWKTHGQLESIDEGMAVSCNLMFAQMGIDLGWAAIRKTYTRFFDRQDHPMLFGAYSFGEMLHTPQNDYELGRMSIGLDHLATTTSGLVQIPAAIVGLGMKYPPRVFLKCNNILGETYRTNIEPKPNKVFQPSTAKPCLSP